jgi:hypothetical protein
MMKQFTKICGISLAETNTKRLQNVCRELNKSLNCNTESGTLGYRTSCPRKNSCNDWSTVLITILVTEWLAKI